MRSDKCPICQELLTDDSRDVCGKDESGYAFRLVSCKACASLMKVETGNLPLSQVYCQDYHSFRYKPGTATTPNMLSRVERIAEVCQPRRILDVGCGNGAVVEAYKARGWDAYGVDPYLPKRIVELSPIGDRLYSIDITKQECPVQGFDCVSIFYVLEHLRAPAQLLDAVRKHLRQRGTLIVLVPWAESLAARCYQAKWLEAVHVDHVSFYSRQGMAALLHHTGFQMENYRIAGAPFPMHRWVEPTTQSSASSSQRTNSIGKGVGHALHTSVERWQKKVGASSTAGLWARRLVHIARLGDYLEVTARAI